MTHTTLLSQYGYKLLLEAVNEAATLICKRTSNKLIADQLHSLTRAFRSEITIFIARVYTQKFVRKVRILPYFIDFTFTVVKI